jgi:hypothetical protein
MRALDRLAREELERIARTVEAFDVHFERVRRLDGVVWIEPEPAEPFAALTATIVERWPSHRPYGGMFDVVIPHLTVVESDAAPLEVVEAIAAKVVPFTGRANRLEAWCEDPAGRWRTRWRIPLSVRP